MQFHNNPGMGILAGTDLAQYLLVKRDGTLCGADASRDWLGVTMEPKLAGDNVPVRFSTAGTIPCTAVEAITAGALVYKAALGKVGLTNTNALVGTALEAAPIGGFLEVMPTR